MWFSHALHHHIFPGRNLIDHMDFDKETLAWLKDPENPLEEFGAYRCGPNRMQRAVDHYRSNWPRMKMDATNAYGDYEI